MARAIWNGVTIAESQDTVVVEGNHYFPRDSLIDRFFKPSTHSSDCPWKGAASYYHLDVDGNVNEDAAWFYSEPKAAAANIQDRIAFWKGVIIEA